MSKGSSRRLRQCTPERFADNWDNLFPKTKMEKELEVRQFICSDMGIPGSDKSVTMQALQCICGRLIITEYGHLVSGEKVICSHCSAEYIAVAKPAINSIGGIVWMKPIAHDIVWERVK
jgi:hypothetical protein